MSRATRSVTGTEWSRCGAKQALGLPPRTPIRRFWSLERVCRVTEDGTGEGSLGDPAREADRWG